LDEGVGANLVAVFAEGDFAGVEALCGGLELVGLVDFRGHRITAIPVEVMRASDEANVVALFLFQQLGEQNNVSLQRQGEQGLLETDRRATTEDRLAGRYTLRGSGVGTLEADRLGGEAVEVRGYHVGITVAAHVRGRVVVRDDEKDVERLWRGIGSGGG
jgi:hypothetical protein